MENRYKFKLDLKYNTNVNAKFKQNDIDTSILDITLYDNGLPVDITGQTVEFAFLKPDNTIVLQDSTSGVSILDAVKGHIQCILKSNTLAAVGTVSAEIIFLENGKRLTSTTFTVTVDDSIDNGEGVLSTNEIPIVDAKIAEVDAKIAAIDSADIPTLRSDVNSLESQLD